MNQALSDRWAISERIAEYAYRWDGKDASGFSELFTEDGSMDVWVAGEPADGSLVEGRGKIEAYSVKAHTERLAGRQSRHHFTNLIFKELTADHAITEHMVHVTHLQPGMKPESIATGYYRIEWKKVGESWLIRHRRLHLDR